MNIWTFYFQIVHNRGHEVFNDEWTFGLCQWAVAQIVFPPLVRNSGMCGCGLKSNWACMNLMNYKKKKRLKRLSALFRSCYNVEVCCVWEALAAGLNLDPDGYWEVFFVSFCDLIEAFGLTLWSKVCFQTFCCL